MSSAGSSAIEAAKRQSTAAYNTAKEAVSEAPAAVKSAAENPQKATNDLLHAPAMRAALPFINGGLAGMTATTVIQPIDMIKVRLQLAGEGVKTGPKPTPLSVTREVIAAGKVLDLYTGLSAGLLRQAVYTTARLGFFDTFMKTLSSRAEAKGTKIGFKERAGAGLTAGGLAAMCGNPADLALIRMQSDGLKPPEKRANYRSVVDALTRIAKSEGVTALWAGAYPTVVRAMALNFGQLAFFSEAKTRLKDTSMSPRAQTLTASAIAGFFASFFSLPFDFIKTRLQKQTRAADGSLPYKGMADCFRKVMKDEGPLRFYRGFSTYYVRIAPHAMVTLIVADYLGFITK
ncbi:mitochondrial 2-oxoglutarate/malate carrier protein-like protein [Saccharata proteae CBS 121410]|uniref:Mitochondrial 2-oxoglutarate/malate carrier protein-like protein n=1 Tax=Saccharata proteae CBS 121410 TaxID=1314787 RepID=A0A9P4I4Y3_9PEZI|nr:mitochondrial 2-oxoglutarate/malate carrier protein-like protein [Saccharata proteae CBS 121410]